MSEGTSEGRQSVLEKIKGLFGTYPNKQPTTGEQSTLNAPNTFAGFQGERQMPPVADKFTQAHGVNTGDAKPVETSTPTAPEQQPKTGESLAEMAAAQQPQTNGNN